MAMVPHERSLVKKLESKPFALLGVDLDESPEALKKAEEESKITWRSWFDGKSKTITKQYNVKALPTIYVIDAQGVIRNKDVHGEEMEKAVDELLKEIEPKQ